MGYGSKSIADWQEEAHEIAKSKGWHDDARTFGDMIALMHSELSEALEEYRKHGEDAFKIVYDNGGGSYGDRPIADDSKPIGIPIEFADVVIRILDTCEMYGIRLESAMRIKTTFNRTRPNRHGGKRL